MQSKDVYGYDEHGQPHGEEVTPHVLGWDRPEQPVCQHLIKHLVIVVFTFENFFPKFIKAKQFLI